MIDTLPQLDAVDAKVVMREMYETRFGIHNHLNKFSKRPLASVAFHGAENTIKDSMLEETLKTYANRNIKDIFGLTVLEFLELPMDVVSLMLDIADQISAKKEGDIDGIQRDLNKMMRH